MLIQLQIYLCSFINIFSEFDWNSELLDENNNNNTLQKKENNNKKSKTLPQMIIITLLFDVVYDVYW